MLFKFFSNTGANVLIIDYHGYGHSEGTPSERALQYDSEATLDWALENKEIDSSKIFIFGRSLGGAVAINLCHKRQKDICGLMVENTFTSLSKS